MEQTSILALEMHRDDIGPSFLNEPRRKHFPRQVLRAAKALRRGGNATGGEDDDDRTSLEQAQSLMAYRHVRLDRVLRLGEVDGKRVWPHLADLQQVGGDHDAEGPFQPFG